jgi:hypothetical protein
VSIEYLKSLLGTLVTLKPQETVCCAILKISNWTFYEISPPQNINILVHIYKSKASFMFSKGNNNSSKVILEAIFLLPPV